MNDVWLLVAACVFLLWGMAGEFNVSRMVYNMMGPSYRPSSMTLDLIYANAPPVARSNQALFMLYACPSILLAVSLASASAYVYRADYGFMRWAMVCVAYIIAYNVSVRIGKSSGLKRHLA